MASNNFRPTALDEQLAKEMMYMKGQGKGKLELPPANYYIHGTGHTMEDESSEQGTTGINTEDDPFDLKHNAPIGRAIIEAQSRFKVERNLFDHEQLKHTFQPRHANHFQDEEIELEAMIAHPPSFIFLGKPGVGKTTLAKKLATKLNCVYISPQSIIQHYKYQKEVPLGIKLVKMDGIINLMDILTLLHARTLELDVFHKGYVLDGFPILRSAEVEAVDQLDFIQNTLPLPPHHAIILHMQDLDLFKRRRDQKYDPLTGTIYTRDQYIHKLVFDPVPSSHSRREQRQRRDGPLPRGDEDDESGSREVGSQESYEDSELGSSQDLSGIEPFVQEPGEEPPDFEAMPPYIMKRLLTREEDFPWNVDQDLKEFRDYIPVMQSYLKLFDRRRILEINAYWQPSILFKMILEFTDNFGISPAPVPTRLIPNMENPGMFQVIPEDQYYDSDELGEEQPCVPYEEVFTGEVDWEAALRAVTVRSRVDPRFRWRISHWKNFCPVALKNGNTILGKPELAVGFMDKVYFLHSEAALQQFEFNPRPYLLPVMPTSPLKFFIVGHPLAGKTVFANKLAMVTGAYVIDMKRQFRKRYPQIKADYLFRTRLQGVLEITQQVDRENFIEWKRLERNRRDEVFKWIERFIRMRANAEINAMLDMEKDERRRHRMELRAASEYHQLGDIYTGSCTTDTGTGGGFTWNDFVKAMREGRRNFTHQQNLELAWHLFHEGKLRYKVNKRALARLLRRQRPRDSVEEEEDEELDGEGAEVDVDADDEWPGEGSEDDSDEGESRPIRRKKRRRRKRKICAPVAKDGPVAAKTNEEPEVESDESSVFGSDEETDESIRLRFPEIPSELIEGIPRPSNVTEFYPLVLERLEKKNAEAETWTNTNPPELYIEALKGAIVEAEEKHLPEHQHGPLSGGWIVENLPLDIEKWRIILRTPETKPDHVIVLCDTETGHPNLIRNLKQVHADSKPRRFSEYLGEAGEGEILGEDGGLPIRLEKSQLEMTMSEFLINCLPIDQLGLSNVVLSDMEPAVVAQHLRNVSKTDSVLDPDQRRILAEWLQSFDEPDAGDLNEEIDPNVPPAVSPHLKVKVIGDISGPLEVDTEWTPRKINYEMLSTYQYGGSVTEESAPSSAEISAPSTANEGRNVKSPTQEFIDEYEGEMTTSLLDLVRGERGDATPASLLSKEDLLCPPEAGPEDPPCTPFIHEPSLKRIFERQIQQFDDWYNMLHSLLQKESVLSWQIGIVDLDTAYDKALSFYEDLERRFEFSATRITPNQLKEEMDEWKDANKIWALHGAGNKAGTDQDSELGEAEEDVDWEAGWAGEGDDELPEFLKYRDPFERLLGRPEEYRQAVVDTERLHYYGDLKYFCPVTLFHFNLLRRGKYAAKWLDRTYLMADPEFRDHFVENPIKFLPSDAPLKVPPPRICVTGSPGCGQEEVALKVAMDNKIYYVNFRQRLHEIIKVKLGHDVGPGRASTLTRAGMLAASTSDVTLGSLPDLIEEEEEGEFEGPYSRAMVDPEMDEFALRNLGILKPVRVSACPQTSLDRTEELAERNWTNMSTLEMDIKRFLESGFQLPHAVLDEFVAPLWKDEPFRSKGFVLVGFPNTAADLEWLIRRRCFPEFVHILDSKPRTMRNRLVLKTVADWKALNPVKKKRKMSERGTSKPRPRVLSERDKSIIMNEYMPLPVSDDDEAANKFKIQKNTLTERVTRSLLHFHRIYSHGLKQLMMAMNRERIDWNVIHTDLSLSEAKRTLTNRLTNVLKYRSSLFEATFELSSKEAAMLLERSYFRLSKFGRFCPVEAYRTNTTINKWHAPGVVKYPFLHRNYIYFVAGAENAVLFRQNVWEIVKRDPPTATMPLFIIINGPAKSGKTELAKRIVDQMGLVYISQESVINDTVRHSFLNQDTDFDMSPSNLMSGPMSMVLADEILAYLRGGYMVPNFMFYRALDLALMAPRAQFHGVVFDDYPLEEAQVQELLERGIVPTVVVNLKMDPKVGYRRSFPEFPLRDYNYEDMVPDCWDFLDYLNEDYQPSIEPCIEWYQKELQCLQTVDATLSPKTIYERVALRSLLMMSRMQDYIDAVLKRLPARIQSTGALTSLLPMKLSPQFGNFDPVALNETNELVRVHDLTDLTRLIEYKQQLYAFASSKHVEMFMRNPRKYTPPRCLRLPPVEVPVPCILTDEEIALLEEHWGFMSFDPVFYVEGNLQFKWLKHCEGRFCVEYREKIYFFLNANNMEKFLRQPQKYINLPMPARVPAKESRPLDSLTPSGYVIASGLTQQLSQILAVVGSKRPRFPYMSATRSGLLYMGYYLKTLNNEAKPELRQHYRRAMAHMTRTQHVAEQLMRQVDRSHGLRHISPLLKQRLDNYMLLASKTDKEKVVDPFIPGLPLNFDKVPDPEQAMFNDILADLLKQRAAGCCSGGSGDADRGPGSQEDAGEDEEEEMEDDTQFYERVLNALEDYVVPAYLAKDRLV